MLKKKTLITGLSAVVLTGTVFGAEAFSDSEPVHAAAASETPDQSAKELVNRLYQSAFKGEMPQDVKGLKINQSTKQDVYDKIGEPERKADGSNPFDLYSWNMGHPGYGFSYRENGTISEIRYFGTGVERRFNLGSVTPDVLSKQIGSADKTLAVPGTGETDYVYNTGDYELHFVIGSGQKADHVNVKAR
ncbi:YjgB family protein [Bacillus sp. ISL-51]|uniref:YjgB family protein n=1 Tax=Bacteria TaxID=2 RepID=UPI001BE95904|nr:MULTISPECIES: YjgB family protein [Bacteria]MBT2573756.1 YjgB family protein [Bacillus sp. ISL-51]MBT2634913.1 YjgB family protein [Bacillus sp. ISL-26]MBT2712387.1 YjgB family protein [Pseudomonas sp. ISL-88]